MVHYSVFLLPPREDVPEGQMREDLFRQAVSNQNFFPHAGPLPKGGGDYFSIPSRTRRSMSSPKDIPAVFAARGRRLVFVMPGSVLVSRM